MNIQNAISTLLIAQPYPIEFNQSTLDNELLTAEITYNSGAYGFVTEELNSVYRLEFKDMPDLITKLTDSIKNKEMPLLNDCFSAKGFNGMYGHLYVKKAKSTQKQQLKELLANVESEYRQKVEKSQADHVTTLTEQCLQEIEQQKLDDYKAEQQKAKEAIAAAFMANK